MLERELAEVPSVRRAHIFGSWTARHVGVAGPPPQDVDVLVGDSDREQLQEFAERVGSEVHRGVNMVLIATRGWADTGDDDPFLASVRSGPLVEFRPAAGEERAGRGGRASRPSASRDSTRA